MVISALVNNLRFQFLYYDAFSSSWCGSAAGAGVRRLRGNDCRVVQAKPSALGNLVGLRSAGTLLVAARKAYFDYPNFGSPRLFDTLERLR